MDRSMARRPYTTALHSTPLIGTLTPTEDGLGPFYFGGCSYVGQIHDVSCGKDKAKVGTSNDLRGEAELTKNSEADVR